jgi:16S rRNA (cytidine1402-2'-O)-methyltransferase
LRNYGLDKPSGSWMALHQHNENSAAEQVILRLQQGQRVVYLSDAGTPGISDPGARLVALVQAAGLRVMPVPGASSVTTVLSASGCGGDGQFVFLGFLSSKASERQAAVQAMASEPRAQVFLEAPHRIEAVASALEVLGPRPLTVGRELTKQFEEIALLPAAGFSAWLKASAQRSKGEFALVLHPMPQASSSLSDAERVLALLLSELPVKTAVKLAAEISGAPRNRLYELALQKTAAKD